MPRRTGAIIPSPVDPSGTYRRVLCIPASPDWIALVTGALYPLTQAWYWDANSGDVDAVVERAKQFYFEYQDQSGDCDVSDGWDIGDIKTSAVDAVPTKWLRCDGASLLRADYPDLFSAIGVQFGAVDGTHFNIPDFRMRSPMGDGALNGNDEPYGTFPIGLAAGDIKNLILVENLPAHHHSYGSGAASGSVGNATVYTAGVFQSPTLNTGDTGGGLGFSVLHPVQVVRILIKALP